MKRKELLAGALILALTASMVTACGENAGSGSSGQSSGSAGPGAQELYIYSSKGETADQFAELCRLYEDETGVKVKAFSIGSGQDHMETLRAEMQADVKAQPAIFTIQGLKELIEWKDSGRALDLTKVSAGPFKDLADAIPESLRLTSDGADSYGIPYNVEGYGYIMDHQMLTDLIDGDEEACYRDLVTCSYEEFEAFVQAVDSYIKLPSAASVTLSGNAYAFKPEKTGLAANLNGVFAVAATEKWTYGDHTLNVAVNAVFPTVSAANYATEQEIDALKGPFRAYARAMDLKTSFLAGPNGPAVRGQDFVVATNFGYDPTVQTFADGKALFMKNGNWAGPNIENVNKDIAVRLGFVPVKLPLTQEDIRVEGWTVAEFNSTIPVYVPMYYAINAKKDEATIRAAEDFLVWMNTTQEGKAFITDRFEFIPYNADPADQKLKSALGNSILEFMKTGKTLAAPYLGAPASWGADTVGQELMENYFTKSDWTDADYDAIADFAVQKWKEMKASA